MNNNKFSFRSAVCAFFASMLLCPLSSCDDDESAGASVAKVTIQNDDNNALRYPVTVATTADCEVQLYYWPVEAPSKVRNSKSVSTSAQMASPMITFVLPDTDYKFAVSINGVRQQGEYDFHTSSLPAGVPIYNVVVDSPNSPRDGYILQWAATKPGYITFCDMQGNVVWYEKFDQAIRMAHYNKERGEMCVLTGFRDGVNSKNFQRLCDKIITLDLEGNRNVNWIASEDNVPYPHHDIKFTPSGDLIMVSNFIKNYDLSQFGLGDDTPVWGDGFTVISTEGRVERTWDNFDTLDPYNSNDVIKEAGATKDFLHANSVNWDSEGNYYMTFNRINQLWKIDAATGKVLYRVGPDGNVAMDKSGYSMGLHAAEPLAPDMVLCYDNGSDRGYSRAIIYRVNPVTMTAEVVLSVPIPNEYSSTDRSNVQLIRDGKMLMFGNTLGRSNVFTDLDGNILKVITRVGISYRSYYYEDI